MPCLYWQDNNALPSSQQPGWESWCFEINWHFEVKPHINLRIGLSNYWIAIVIFLGFSPQILSPRTFAPEHSCWKRYVRNKWLFITYCILVGHVYQITCIAVLLRSDYKVIFHVLQLWYYYKSPNYAIRFKTLPFANLWFPECDSACVVMVASAYSNAHLMS